MKNQTNTTDNNMEHVKSEFEKCKESPYYFFKNYVLVDGKPPTIKETEQEFNEKFKNYEN